MFFCSPYIDVLGKRFYSAQTGPSNSLLLFVAESLMGGIFQLNSGIL